MSNITITGLVATTPRHIVTQDGLAITSFRIASPVDILNDGRVSDSATNWYTVTSYKQLAINTAMSISKGDRIFVSGILKVRDWDNGERAGTSVEVEAQIMGHDINFGTSVFERNVHMSNDGTRTALPVTTPEEESEPAHSCSCGACGISN